VPVCHQISCSIYEKASYLRNLIVGVVGLTTAVKIQERGNYDVTILAEVLPDDPKTIQYTSQWAVSASLLATNFLMLSIAI